MNEHTTVETKPRAVFSTEDLTLIKEIIYFIFVIYLFTLIKTDLSPL